MTFLFNTQLRTRPSWLCVHCSARFRPLDMYVICHVLRVPRKLTMYVLRPSTFSKGHLKRMSSKPSFRDSIISFYFIEISTCFHVSLFLHYINTPFIRQSAKSNIEYLCFIVIHFVFSNLLF